MKKRRVKSSNLKLRELHFRVLKRAYGGDCLLALPALSGWYWQGDPPARPARAVIELLLKFGYLADQPVEGGDSVLKITEAGSIVARTFCSQRSCRTTP